MVKKKKVQEEVGLVAWSLVHIQNEVGERGDQEELLTTRQVMEGRGEVRGDEHVGRGQGRCRIELCKWDTSNGGLCNGFHVMRRSNAKKLLPHIDSFSLDGSEPFMEITGGINFAFETQIERWKMLHALGLSCRRLLVHFSCPFLRTAFNILLFFQFNPP